MKGLITRQAMKAQVPDPQRDTYLWDTKIAGFFLKTTPKGAQSFYLHYRMGGRSSPTRRFFIGRVAWMSLEKARELAGAAKLDVHQGIDPFEKKARSQGRLVLDVGREWLTQSKVKKKARSSLEDERLFTKHVLPALGRRFIQQVTRRDIEAFHGTLSATPILANRIMSVLGSIFSYAERHEYREKHTNPVQGIEKYPERSRERRLHADELRRFLTTLARCERERSLNQAFIHLIRVLLYTGCRRDEIRTLQWSQVDLQHKVLNLPDTKTGPRVIHLNTLAVEEFKKIKKQPGNPYVIVSPSKPGHPLAQPHPLWRRLCEKANLIDFRIHDLRHEFASLAVTLGIPLYSVGKLLGHTQAATTQKYSHLDSGPLKLATESISDALKLLMTNPPPSADVVTLSTPKKGR